MSRLAIQLHQRTIKPLFQLDHVVLVRAQLSEELLRARKYLTVTVAYGTCTMPIWLTTTCPKTLIVTLWDVLESGNAKNRINLTCSVCARCGDEVLCGAGTPFFGHVQMSACERA